MRLLAAAERCGTVGSDVFITLVDSTTYTQAITTLRAQLGEQDFITHWTQGQVMTLDQGVDYALAMLDTSQPDAKDRPPGPALASPAYPAGLTAREVEVLRLLAQGFTYAQIAETLVISRRTVNGHLTSIYSKLGVTSRMAAARFAQDHSLL